MDTSNWAQVWHSHIFVRQQLGARHTNTQRDVCTDVRVRNADRAAKVVWGSKSNLHSQPALEPEQRRRERELRGCMEHTFVQVPEARPAQLFPYACMFYAPVRIWATLSVYIPVTDTI
jgi:hypothetical protein